MMGVYVKFLKSGFCGERLNLLENDDLRWRWWRLYCLSDQETFPGLVSKKLAPLSQMTIVGEVYLGNELKESEKLSKWQEEKIKLINVGLLRSAKVNGSEYLWNVNFHQYQDKFSKKGAQQRDKFYTSFLKLNDRDKAIFIVLLSKFRPFGIDLRTFGVPDFLEQLEAYANRRSSLLDGCKEEDFIKSLLVKITENVQAFEVEANSKRSVETKEFMNWYFSAYERKTGRPYLVAGKDFKLVSGMLKIFSINDLRSLAERFFREEDTFVKKAGFTIGVFKVMINRLVSTNERRQIGTDDYSKYCKD